MQGRSLRKAGHSPSLVAAFLHFDVSSICWVLLGALGVAIATKFHLKPADKGLMVGVPLVAGSAFRLLLGALSDRFGPKWVGVSSMAFTAVPLLWGWLAGTSFNQVLAIGVLLGVAGASFAVSLPLASRVYPKEYQGLVMGITGAGNVGTAIAAFFGPRLAPHVGGWHGVFGLCLIPTAITTVTFAVFARDVPGKPRAERKDGATLRVLRDPALWRFCAFYLVTFGAFVGLVSFTPILLHDQFKVTKLDAGGYAALIAVSGALVRPFGGYIADKVGGVRVMLVAFVLIAVCAAGLAGLPALGTAVTLLIAIAGVLGLGNGAVFQLVPQRFGRDIGKATGIVGAAGGLGGFLLPYALGSLKGSTGSYGTGFAVLAVCAVSCLMLALWVSRDAAKRLIAPLVPAPAPTPAPEVA